MKLPGEFQDWLNARAYVVVTQEAFHTVGGRFDEAERVFAERHKALIDERDQLRGELQDAKNLLKHAERRVQRMTNAIAAAQD